MSFKASGRATWVVLDDMSGTGLDFLLAGFVMVDCEDSKSVLPWWVGSGRSSALENRVGVVVAKVVLGADRRPGNDWTRLGSDTLLRCLLRESGLCRSGSVVGSRVDLLGRVDGGVVSSLSLSASCSMDRIVLAFDCVAAMIPKTLWCIMAISMGCALSNSWSWSSSSSSSKRKRSGSSMDTRRRACGVLRRDVMSSESESESSGCRAAASEGDPACFLMQ